jgi:hypothetical protein
MPDLKTRLLALKSPSEIVRKWFYNKTTGGEKICTTCSHIGIPTEEMSGRREIELTLWAIFSVIAVVFFANMLVGELSTNLQFLRFVHGLHRMLKRVGELFVFLSLVYTIFRVSSQQQHCAKCSATTVIPLDSPRAKELLKGR